MLILTKGKDSPTIVYYVLVSFSDNEEGKYQKFPIKSNNHLKKKNAARASTLSKNPKEQP